MKKMSIKWKMTLSFSIISTFVILSCLLIAYINSNSTANIFFNHFEQTKNEFSLITIQTEATLKGNLQIIDENINQNFDLFFNKTESLLNSMVNSHELDILSEHNQLSRGNISSSPYITLPQWNKSQVNNSLNPFLENIVKSYNEIQLAYVTTPDKATYMGPIPSVNLYDFDGTQRIWYTGAIKNNGVPYWTDAYVDKVSNKPITTLSEVVKRNNKIVGVLGLDVSLNTLSQMVSQTKIGKTGYSLLTDKNGLILVDAKDNSLIGQTIQSKFSQLKPIFDNSQGFFEYTVNKTDILVHYTTNKNTGWKIVTTIEKNDLLSSAASLKNMETKNDIALNNAQHQNKIMIVSLLMIGTLGLVIVFAGSFSLSKNISKKIDLLQSSINKVSNGDLSEEIPFKDGDEIDNLSNQFKSMTEQLRSLILSNKQLSNKIESSTTNLASFTEEASSQTQEVSSHVKQVANLTEEQAIQTREASEIAQSFSKAIQKVNDTTEVVKRLVENASVKEKEGTVSVLNLEEASNENLIVSERVFANIKDLIEQIKKVSSFTLMIKSISEQTNLLSLNAAIEAARAGEHGKGFAVVADEVKKLAVESSQTASKIENIINSIEKQTVISVENLSKTEQIVKSQHEMVNQTRNAFSNIQDSIQDVLYQMNEVAQVMEDINQGKEKFVKAINTINELSESTASSYQNIAVTSEEQVIAIEDLNIATQALAEMADKLSKEVNRFKI